MENKLHRDAPLRGNKDINHWFPQDGLYAEMYEEARKGDMTFSMYLEKMKSKGVGDTTPYYGLTPSEVFALRKSYELKGEPAPMTAMEELLFRAGIKASGSRTDTVGKLFEYSDLEVLVPEIMSNKIYAGLLMDSLVPKFIATETVVRSGYDYKKLYISDTEQERQTSIITPGKDIGETQIGIAQKSIQMRKFGTYLTITYETLEWQRLNVWGVCLERIGKQIQIDETDDMFYTIVNGDGNTSTTAGTTVKTVATGVIATQDVIGWATGLPMPYKLSVFAGRKTLLQEYLATLVGMNNPFNAYSTGIALPQHYEWDRTIITSDTFVGVDSRYGVEHLTSGGVLTESEKIIRKQINGTAITYWAGFGIIDNQATGIFDETWS